MSKPSSSEPVTMAVLGCGTMGICILAGILTSLKDTPTTSSSSSSPLPSQLPSRFLACVRSPKSAARISTALGNHPSLTILQSSNVAAVQQSSVVLLACKPASLSAVLAEDGMRDALSGKLLISVLAGVSAQQIQDVLYPKPTYSSQLQGIKQLAVDCTIVRALPNVAAGIRRSMTVVEQPTAPLDPETEALVNWILGQIGEVSYLPAHQMDAGSALCGSGPAFFALMLEAAVDGAVAMGVPRDEAVRMAAQTMRGTAEMVLGGEHPALLKDKVATPGGCTMGGLLVLEEGGVRGSVSRAVREATVVVGLVGKGVVGVNGTRGGGVQM